MNWTAIVPIKPPEARKTRLGNMDPAERLALTNKFLAHVLATLDGHPDIAEIFLLSDMHRAGMRWIEDKNRGLNAELEDARNGRGPILIVHADLPRLSRDDVSELLACAEHHEGAIAPDRHGTGTNAIALLSRIPFRFCFGPDSRRFHQAQLCEKAVVMRPGLAFDIDSPDDLRLLETTFEQPL